ncbi:hypothetical protein K6119_13350 [Paracrocinitomix mangrovi]|uniref:hypothetical protein n=1 Tax=Paracrocinitomix mangrovi TaxID=2862509 RepID=UPI001C8D2FC0|nr:hypothetical protein [Paracrocinitomix mangrovi]UKN00717.1 hypothetical protein K6119_13350 [Paracrocinitomix mangrovi]
MKKLLALILFSLLNTTIFAQSIAIGKINTYKVYADPSMASKLVRLEFIKLEKYSVLDEFDMLEIDNVEQFDDCFAKDCLLDFGQLLSVDFIVSGSIDKISDKIVVTLKMLDVKQKSIIKTATKEFEDNEVELQRMIGIVIKNMHDVENDPELVKRLEFKNEVITSTNYDRVRNSGPRIGMAYAYGSLNEFMTRSENRGGLDIVPMLSVIGYQFEVQYVGTEKFSALFEFLPMFLGLEQGQFVPSLAVMNGFRFGRAGWEFAFGPSFGLTKESYGFFDKQAVFGDANLYWTEKDLFAEGYASDAYEEYGYKMEPFQDVRGDVKFSTRWIMAFGRTFSSGSLNIPVNVFHSSQKGGAMVGVSVGFNITKSKKKIKTN